jgi:hypothetical protein
MRLIYIVLFFNIFSWEVESQATLISTFPTDTFDLSCSTCTTKIRAMAIARGQQSIPINLDKPIKVNLLHWKYYDDISKEDVTMEERPSWTEGTQLLDALGPEEPISFHINLEMIDSTNNKPYRIFLVMSGITPKNLRTIPLETTFDADTYAIFRFSALVQVSNTENQEKETYDCIEGNCTLEKLDTKAGQMRGYFNFVGSRVGIEKKIFFTNGQLKQ